jgi:hypothetical protein
MVLYKHVRGPLFDNPCVIQSVEILEWAIGSAQTSSGQHERMGHMSKFRPRLEGVVLMLERFGFVPVSQYDQNNRSVFSPTAAEFSYTYFATVTLTSMPIMLFIVLFFSYFCFISFLRIRQVFPTCRNVNRLIIVTLCPVSRLAMLIAIKCITLCAAKIKQHQRQVV